MKYQSPQLRLLSARTEDIMDGSCDKLEEDYLDGGMTLPDVPNKV